MLKIKLINLPFANQVRNKSGLTESERLEKEGETLALKTVANTEVTCSLGCVGPNLGQL